MAVLITKLVLVFLVVVCDVFSYYAYAAGGFSVDLVRRDSPDSPYYNATKTSRERLRGAYERSMGRARGMAAAKASDVLVEANVIPNNGEYLMSVSLGTLAFSILAILDTGSDLIWTQCKPCDECYKQDPPMFDPSSSSTFRDVSCTSDSCDLLPNAMCGSHSVCEYTYEYGDNSIVMGGLSSETFTFEPSSRTGRQTAIPKIRFGCTHQSKGTFSDKGSGLVGLGGGPLSLVSQLGASIDHRFSYCLVPYEDVSAKSTINFGSSAVVHGGGVTTTPIIRGVPNTFYYLSLQEVIVGQTRIPVSDFADDNDGNIIIDSGTTLTLLRDDVLRGVVRAIQSEVDLPSVSDPQGFFDLCYMTADAANAKLPDITFRFLGDADVVLNPVNLFLGASDTLTCLTLVSAGQAGGIQIFGNIAQQNFHVGYDLGEWKLSLAPADCTNY